MLKGQGGEGKGDKTVNKDYNINQLPLPINVDPDTQIADLFAFPTVHEHTGIVNKVFNYVEEVVGPAILVFPRQLHLKGKDYHGKVFEVNK